VRRLPWQVLVALLAGMGIGLAYAWVIAPVRYVDTSPNTLRSDFKDSFRTVIAASYAATHNLDRARARLSLLGDADPVQALTAQAQRMLAAGDSFQVIQNVARLASDLQAGESAGVPASPHPPSSTSSPIPTVSTTAAPSFTPASTPTETATDTEPPPTAVPIVTATARPSATPIPTAAAPFELVSREEICNSNLTSGLMQVSVLDRHRHQMPGIKIDISWAGGEETFFTGYKPEIAAGYADYVMQPGVLYAVRVAGAGSPITDLTAPACPDTGGESYMGGLKLVFQQP